jgi:K+-sensing histidine kinase KdpD
LSCQRRNLIASPSENENLYLDYIRAIGHDVGAPLRHIRGFSALLGDEIRQSLKEEPAMLLAQIQASAEIAEQMIYGIHDLAHLAYSVREDAIGSLADLLRSTIPGTGVALKAIDGDADLVSDPRLLRQIILRLCANVTDHAGASQLRVLIDRDEAQVRCHFDDQGSGISEKDWEQAIRPFNRCGKRPSAQHVGLGLTLANQGARSLGGTLSSEQRGDDGFRVTLAIPRRYSSNIG